ncbi:MAG: PAAR domain-containing protein, partial [Snodgrassella sp.]|nr:PAAR domain-containing protein [Snodgrassella sp.]
GGVVLEGDPLVNIEGRPIARKGDKVSCPKCTGIHFIVEGDQQLTVKGRPIALENMKTSCGARLLSRQSIAKCK